ncbi:hypothetical protein INT45_005479 [Circinella minor]|uniref:Uncharacterized protein n=1 Tax=Circinella minor TaxID=1195481 RepID=A0A8H7RW75_9FUNG|nr:hypothetical protein INT45_005479 [Circinella minor]
MEIWKLDIDDLNNHSNTSNASCNATSSDAMTTRHSHSTQHSVSLPSHLQDPVSQFGERMVVQTNKQANVTPHISYKQAVVTDVFVDYAEQQKDRLRRFVINECHRALTWQSFRLFVMLKLRELRSVPVPLLLLTATMPPSMQDKARIFFSSNFTVIRTVYNVLRAQVWNTTSSNSQLLPLSRIWP